MAWLTRLPNYIVTALIALAIVNLLVGVVLRYVVGGITDYMDWDPVRFTWVEEVGEMALAWLALIGAAIGIRSRSHFTLYLLTPYLAPAWQRAIDIFNHLVIAGIGCLAAWHGITLVKLNQQLATPGLEISLGFLYASAVAGGALIVLYAISMIVSPSPHDPATGH